MAISIIEAVAEVVDSTDGASFATGSFTPAQLKHLLHFAWATATNVDAGMSGGSPALTYTQRYTATLGTAQACLYSAFTGSNPGSMQTTYSTGADPATGCALVSWEALGLKEAGLLVQSATNNGLAAATPTVTLPGNLDTNNLYLAILVNISNPGATTVPAGFTSIANNGFATPTTGIVAAHKIGGENTNLITWGGLSPTAWRAWVFELLKADDLMGQAVM